MKKIFTLAILITINFYGFGQNSKFVSSMEKNLSTMDTAQNMATYRSLSNSFERIANAEKKEWLPDYYIAFCYIMMANLETNNNLVDDYCDKADAFLNKADSLKPNNSEIYVLKGWAASSRIKVEPMTRGMKYGLTSSNLQEKAKSLDPSNPRPYFMLGMGKYYTPSAFGGGKDKALPLFTEAVNKFKTFKPSSNIMPKWGEKKSIEMLADCKKD